MRALLLCCALCGVVSTSEAVSASEDGWRALMLDADEPAIDSAHARATAVLDQLQPDAYGQADLAKTRVLLAAPTVAAEYQALLGEWRCRSTQIDSGGVYAYPAFRCAIELTEDGTLMFSKTSGSQRRHGQIYPNNDSSWVFLGGQSVNDEAYRSYSATLSHADEADRAADSVGLLETLKDGRLRIILDAEQDRVEFYELSR